MALRDMSQQAMISVTIGLTDPDNDETRALLAEPSLAGIVPLVVDARSELVTLQPEVPSTERAAQIQIQLGELDGEFDETIRGAFYVMTAWSHLVSAPAKKEAWLRLRDHLFSMGLSLTLRSYREEAGEAEMIQARLSPEVRAELAAIPTPDGTLAQTFDRVVDLGLRIGALEDERTPAAATSPTLAGRVLVARNRWIRAVNALLSVIDMLQVPADGPIARFRDRVQAEAAKRRAPAKASPEVAAPSAAAPAAPSAPAAAAAPAAPSEPEPVA